MQRLVRIHCRGAPSSRLRPPSSPFPPTRIKPDSRPIPIHRLLHHRYFTCQTNGGPSSSRFSFRRIPRARFILGSSAAASIPLVSQTLKDNAKEETEGDELTLEQHLLDTSEEERKDQTYGVRKDRSIFYRFFRHLKTAFLRYIFEPIATGLRFVQLVVIFVPVFATIPLVYIGSRDPEQDNERSGTIWWYSFLVKQMERAGPTFIKVPHLLLTSC
jgi:aarF domain-containing kinase